MLMIPMHETAEYKVYCDLSDTSNPKTVIHNNAQIERTLQGIEPRYSYNVLVSYDPPLSKEQFEVLTVSMLW